MSNVTHVRHQEHYSVGQVGPMEDWDAKLFVGRELGFTGMEVSLNRLPPGQEVPFLHQHKLHEEMYLFIGGQGQFQVDGEVFDVHPGTIVRVMPEGRRAWRNNSDSELWCIVIQANLDSLTGQDGVRLGEALTWQ